jgi:hypothetical protein
MIFSQTSEISIVITSCGRFDLLRKTLSTLDQFNTAPIRAVFITEDSGDEAVEHCLPEHWRPHTRIFINKPRLGQMKSVDLAYSQIETPWIFHCEDDWAFYRPGFIEDSQKLLEADPQALQVWLRSHAHDLAVHSPYVHLGPRQLIEGVAFHHVLSDKADWQGFSFNPGLRRLADYTPMAPFAQYPGEKELSRRYAAANRHALILENDAVLHTGWGEHVAVPEERENKQRRKKIEKIKLAIALVIGLCIGYIL